MHWDIAYAHHIALHSRPFKYEGKWRAEQKDRSEDLKKC